MVSTGTLLLVGREGLGDEGGEGWDVRSGVVMGGCVEQEVGP